MVLSGKVNHTNGDKAEFKRCNMEYEVRYYDDFNDLINGTFFVVNSKEELEYESRKYAEILVKEGWDVAGWNYRNTADIW